MLFVKTEGLATQDYIEANLEVLAMKSIANAATKMHVHVIKYTPE